MTNIALSLAHMKSLEQCAAGDSPVHRVHPGAKLLVTAAYILTVVSFPTSVVSALAAFALYPAILLPLSAVSATFLAPRLAAALPFSLAGGLSNLVGQRAPVCIIASFTVTVGMLSFVSILLKTLLCVSAVLLLIATTPFPVIAGELHRFGVPRILCLQLSLTYRYLSVLMNEAQSMYSAYTLRAAVPRVKFRDMGVFLGQLILRSTDRAERVYTAMRCRGFRGTFGYPERRFTRSDWLFLLISLAAFLALRVFNLPLSVGLAVSRFGGR